MDNKTFAKLVVDLREDKKLFHAFIFEPDAALKKLTYLDDSTKRMLQAIDPRSFIADAAGLLDRATLACGPATTVSGPCGGVTCGGSTCGVTCTESSCGNTCGNSCGYTTDFSDRFRDPMNSLHSASTACGHTCGPRTMNFGAGSRDLASLRSFALDEGRVWDDAYIAWE